MIMPKSLDAKAHEPIFVYVNTHIINKIHRCVQTDHDKRVWGTKIHQEGKVGAKRIGNGDSLVGLSPSEYYNIIPTRLRFGYDSCYPKFLWGKE